MNCIYYTGLAVTVNFIFTPGDPNVYRVRTGPGKPGKSWNFIMAFSRTGKTLVLERSGNLLNSTKKYEVAGKEN